MEREKLVAVEKENKGHLLKLKKNVRD